MKTVSRTKMDRRSALRGIVTVSGAAVTLPLMSSLAGCSSASANLSSDKLALIDIVTDLIIPQTDTPGARAAGVTAYVEAVFADHFTEEQQINFAAGLDIFDKTASIQGSGSFADITPELQSAVMTELDEKRDGTWQQLRDMTVFGFYTSEQATEELSYEEIPGRYDGCLPLDEVGRAWLDRGV